MFRFARGLWREYRGATAIEYGLLAGLLAIFLIGVFTTTGTSMNTSYNNLGTTISSAG